MFVWSSSRDLVIARGSLHGQEAQHPANVESTQSVSLRQTSVTASALAVDGVEGAAFVAVVEASSERADVLGECGSEGPGSPLHASTVKRATKSIGATTRMSRA